MHRIPSAISRSITALLHVAAAILLLPPAASSAPPDSPPSYTELTTGLGMGILYEPSLGAGPDNNLSDAYITDYGDEFENNGFQSVRLRLSMDQFFANSTGSYPNLSLNQAFFDDLQFIVDDLLSRHDDSMYVLISPKGLESGTLDDEAQMAKWWGEIAVYFQDYTHRLLFNLMNEPLIRDGEFLDMASIESLYQSLTDAIRSTNPTRYLVYHRIHDEYMSGTIRHDRTPFSETGPGATDFNHLQLPTNHNGYLLFDVHFLGAEDNEGNGEGKRDERLRQTWEFREATGYPVWSGAWNWGAWDTAFSTTELQELVDLMKARAIPGTYLMFNSSNTSIYDGNGTDRDGDGIYNEWTKPEYLPIITGGNPIVWQPGTVYPVTMYAPEHDGTIDSAAPDTSDAEGSKDMRIDANRIREAYVKFNVVRLPTGEVTGAKLRFKARASANDTISVHLANNSNWDESDDDGNALPDLTWNSAPGFGPAIASVLVNADDDASSLDTALNDNDWLDPAAYTHPSWYEVDVSSAITGPGRYSFVLTGSNGALTRIWTRDSDGTTGTVGTWKYYPRLEVTVATANSPPSFNSDPVVEVNATEGQAYSATLADDAADPDSDPLSFSKVSGPAWLNIATDGSLSGTPGVNDVGANAFVVQVDATGGNDTAALNIQVDAVSGGSFTTLTFDDFESGWGNWADAGADASLSSQFALGNQSLNLQDDSNSSKSKLGNSLDLSGYSELKIEFSYVVQSFENAESFSVRYSDDGSSTWTTLQTFVNDIDFVDDGTRYSPVILVNDSTINFTSDVRIQFRCEASNNGDDVYIDDIRISAQ